MCNYWLCQENKTSLVSPAECSPQHPPLTSFTASLLHCFPGGSHGNETACYYRRPGFRPWVGKIPWRKEWLPTPVFLPGEFRGQRSLVGYSPWVFKESDTTEQQTLSHFYFFLPPKVSVILTFMVIVFVSL